MQATPGASFRPFRLDFTPTPGAAKRKPQHRASSYRSGEANGSAKHGLASAASAAGWGYMPTASAPEGLSRDDPPPLADHSGLLLDQLGPKKEDWGAKQPPIPHLAWVGGAMTLGHLCHSFPEQPPGACGDETMGNGRSTGAINASRSSPAQPSAACEDVSSGCGPDVRGTSPGGPEQPSGAWGGVPLGNGTWPDAGGGVSRSCPEQPAGVPIAPAVEAAPLIANPLNSAVFDLGLRENGLAKLSPPICQPAQNGICQPAQRDIYQPAQNESCQPAQNGIGQPAQHDICQHAQRDIGQPAQNGSCQPTQAEVCPPAQQQGLQQSAEAAAVSRCQFWARDSLGLSSSGLDYMDPAGNLADAGLAKEGPITECQSWASLLGVEDPLEMDPARSGGQAKDGPTTACQLWTIDSLGMNLSGLDRLDRLDPLRSGSQAGEVPITACQLWARESFGIRLSGLHHLDPLGSDSLAQEEPTSEFPCWGGDANGRAVNAHLSEAISHGVPSQGELLQGLNSFDADVQQDGFSHGSDSQQLQWECHDPRNGLQQDTSTAGYCRQPPQLGNQGHAACLGTQPESLEVANSLQLPQCGRQGFAFSPSNQLHVSDEEGGRLGQLQPAQQCPCTASGHEHDVHEGRGHGPVEEPSMEPLLRPVAAGQKELQLAGLLHGLARPASGSPSTATSLPSDRLSALREINSLRGLVARDHKHQNFYKTNLQVGLGCVHL